MKPNLIPTKLFAFILLICIFAGLSSCNLYIEKRRYLKGYHVSHIAKSNKRISDPVKSIPITQTKVVEVEHQTLIQVDYKNVEPTTQNTIKETPLNVNPKAHQRKKLTNQPRFISGGECDILFLKDGTSLEILVTSVNDKAVTYKKCNYPDGPSYEVSMSKVKSIEYKNGEIYQPFVDNTPQKGVTKPTGGMIASLVLGIIGIITAFIALGMVLGFSGFGALIGAIPLAISGLTSLIGIIMSAKYLKKDYHVMGKVAFILSLIAQIISIIALVFIFV